MSNSATFTRRFTGAATWLRTRLLGERGGRLVAALRFAARSFAHRFGVGGAAVAPLFAGKSSATRRAAGGQGAVVRPALDPHLRRTVRGGQAVRLVVLESPHIRRRAGGPLAIRAPLAIAAANVTSARRTSFGDVRVDSSGNTRVVFQRS